MTVAIGSASGTAGGAAPFAAFTHYDASQLMQDDGNLYAALVEFTSGATFDAADWRLLASGPTAVAAPQISGVLGLPVVAEITDLFVFSTGDHTAYAAFGMNAALSGTYEWPHRLLKNVGEIRFVYINPGLTNITVRCGVALTSNAATATAGYFDGKRSVVIEPGGYAISDPIAIDIAAGQTIYERSYVLVGSGETWKITYRNTQTTRCEAGADRTAGGTLADGAIRGYKAAMILGPSPGATMVAAFGDSITWGSGDAEAAAGLDWGYLGRALGPANIPLLNLGKPSEKAQDITDIAVRSARWRFIGAAGKATLMYGINDLDNGRTTANVKADLLTIGTLLQRRNTLVYVCTVTPHSSSSDSWATVGNQTAAANNASRVALNDWLVANAPIDPTTKAAVAIGTGGALLAGQVGHPFTWVFDTCAAASERT